MLCLIRPPVVETFRFVPVKAACLPLGPAYIAAALEAAGRRVCVLDAVGEGPRVLTRYYKGHLVGLRLADLAGRIPAEATAVGISVIFTHEWPAVVHLIDLIKQERPDLPIVLGGEHVTSMPEFSLLTSKADCLVLGEGEETIVELLDVMETGRPLRQVDGIAFREGGSVVVNRRRPRRADVDSIPLPAWHHFKIQTYHENRFVGGMYSSEVTVPVLATRGCPYQCTFCSAPNMWTPNWIPRDPKRVADEIQNYVEKYGARNFPFQDLTAIIRKDWIVAFCREILARGLRITWQLPGGTRSEAIDDEVAGLLKASGMSCMSYAPESGSEQTRKYIKKQMKTDRLFESIRSAAAADLNLSVFLVIGFPHDEPQALRDNLAFIDRLTAEGVTDMSVGYYMALPATEIFHSLWDAGCIRLDRAYFRHILDSQSLTPSQSYCDALSRTEMVRWKFRMMRRFYSGSGTGPGGLLRSLFRALKGLGSGSHSSKLQSAFRRGVQSGFEAVQARIHPRWIPTARERELFEGWDAIYREVRRQQISQGVDPAPADSREIHRGNVIQSLRREHKLRRTLRVSPHGT